MGTRNFMIIKLQNLTGLSKRQLKEFCLMQYCQWDGYPEGQGVTILNFLRKIMKENRWEEFCEKCSKLERDLTKGPSYEEYDFLIPVQDDDEHVALDKIKTTFVKDKDKEKDVYIAGKWGYKENFAVTRSVFEELTSSPETLKRKINYMKAHSGETGAKMLDLIMNDQVREVVFCEEDWPSNSVFCEWGYLIDCTTKELLVYSIKIEEKEEEKYQENPLSFLNAIPLVGRFKIDDLPSDEKFCNELKNSKEYDSGEVDMEEYFYEEEESEYDLEEEYSQEEDSDEEDSQEDNSDEEQEED